ncbi:MAG: hypothetical protein ACMUIP_04080 [bacterium]
MKIKTFYTLMGSALIVLLCAMSSTGQMESESYSIDSYTLNGGGSHSSSESYSRTMPSSQTR